MQLLQEINAAGTTILMVTHNPELAELAHRQLHIIDGQIAPPLAHRSLEGGSHAVA